MARKKLTEKQYAAIELLTQVPQTLTYDEIAEHIGVGRRTLYNWRQDETFSDAMIAQVKRNAIADLPRVMASAPDIIIDDKNAAFFRTWLQSLGALTEKVEVEQTGGNNVDIDAIRARLRGDSSNE